VIALVGIRLRLFPQGDLEGGLHDGPTGLHVPRAIQGPLLWAGPSIREVFPLRW